VTRTSQNAVSDAELAERIEKQLAVDREALAFHLRQAQDGLSAQRDRSVPIVAGGAAVLGGLLLLRALLPHRRGEPRRVPNTSGGAMARATRMMGLATAAWRVWPQVRALARRVQAERARAR